MIGDKSYANNGCSVMRCSLRDDVTTNAGLKRAVDGVSKPGCLLWASMPCIGVSPWQRINRHKPGGLKKFDAHIKDWYKIWTAFKVVARECIKHDGHVAVEWPSACDYWRYHIVQEFFEELQLEKIKFDRCALGLRSDHNDPIRKPWSVAVSLQTMDIYSVPLLSIHVLVRINTLIMNHVLVNTQRKLRVILGLSPMSSTMHGRIVNWRSIGALSRVKLVTLES